MTTLRRPLGIPLMLFWIQTVRFENKFVGPCCGYESMAECTPDIARSLDAILSDSIDPLLDEMAANTPAPVPSTPMLAPAPSSTPAPVITEMPQTGYSTCILDAFSGWSDCSLTCDSGVNGTQFRWRMVIEGASGNCPKAVEMCSCTPRMSVSPSWDHSFRLKRWQLALTRHVMWHFPHRLVFILVLTRREGSFTQMKVKRRG